MKYTYFVVLLTVVSAFVGAHADTIVVGNSNGEVFGRDEFDLATHIPAMYVTLGSPVAALAKCPDRQVVIGLDAVVTNNMTIRTVDTLSTVASGVTPGSAIERIATRPDGHIVFADDADRLYMRDRTDLTAAAPGYLTWPDGVDIGEQITALATLSTGDVVIGTAAGKVILRSADDLTSAPAGAAVTQVSMGSIVKALAVTADDRIVIGLSSGTLDVRSWDTMSVSLDSATFPASLTAVCALRNGHIAVGLADGKVHVRDGSDLSIPISSATFTNGIAVTALACTVGNNLAIGCNNNLVFVRRSDDLSQLPQGFQNQDGLNFNAPIRALAAVPVDFTTCAEAIEAGFGYSGDLDHDCRVTLSDYAYILRSWLECVDPTNEQCDTPWWQ